jgi:hypothetical protein
MKYILVTLLIVDCFSMTVFAADISKGNTTVRSFDDYVKLRYMPSRMDHRNKEPITEIKSKSYTTLVLNNGKVMGTNNSIKKIYELAASLKNKGIASSQRELHISFKRIEVSYMGKIISLESARNSNFKKHPQYEKEWLEFYNHVYHFLTKDIIP